MQSGTDSTTQFSLKSGIVRFLLIAVYFAAVAGVIHISVATHHIAAESSLIELSQLALLGITVGAFHFIAQTNAKLRSAAKLISAFFLCLMIRELDAMFDLIAHGFWKYPALTVAGIAIYQALKDRKEAYQSLLAVVNARNFNPLILGMALLLVFSRLYGMGDLWESAMGVHFVRDVKDLAEEGTELLAYSVICLSSIGYWIEAAWSNKHETQKHAHLNQHFKSPQNQTHTNLHI